MSDNYNKIVNKANEYRLSSASKIKFCKSDLTIFSILIFFISLLAAYKLYKVTGNIYVEYITIIVGTIQLINIFELNFLSKAKHLNNLLKECNCKLAEYNIPEELPEKFTFIEEFLLNEKISLDILIEDIKVELIKLKHKE